MIEANIHLISIQMQFQYPNYIKRIDLESWLHEVQYPPYTKVIICVRGIGVYHHFQQYFSYIMAISFIGVRETRVPREWPEASHWQTLSHNVVSSIPYNELDLNSQFQRWYFQLPCNHDHDMTAPYSNNLRSSFRSNIW